MTDTDWREILSFSQKDLKKADKDKLCESLSWMEADDIELNFTDLKTLFRLAQDILKYKSEQVNNLLGQLETSQRKSSKSKLKTLDVDSPAKSSDNILETIAHQEEIIKANKEILQQLYTDIAELEGRKNKIEDENHDIDKESESSRDALSEMNAMAQLENEITVKNRHIRKLLADVKMLEEDNTKFKEKVSILKDKLTEATKLIENFTEQLLMLNNETLNLKDVLGKSEESKAHLSAEVESLRKKLFEKDSNLENAYEKIKSKVQHWKNVAREKKTEIDKLSNENTKLKERVIRTFQPSPSSSPKKSDIEERKIKELQDRLSDASNEIVRSAKMIELLKTENKQLKSVVEEIPDSFSELKNESDDGKQRVIINKLKKKVKILTIALQEAEEMTSIREKELTEITSQLQLVQSEEGIKVLLEGMKDKKKQLKFKNEGIKSLVQEVNALNQLVDDLQLENETIRQKFNISKDENIPTKGILKKYHEIENSYLHLTNEAKEIENKLVSAELENHNLKRKNSKLINVLNKLRLKLNINEHHEGSDSDIGNVNEDISQANIISVTMQHNEEGQSGLSQQDIQAIIEENEGLRKGLEDLLNFLKDNSTTSSGVLVLQCPSLEAILRNMEARHAAGWFAPHMATVLELRAALGGKDALLTALHEARKETFEVMDQLQKEAQKSIKLEEKLQEMESTTINTNEQTDSKKSNIIEFGPWMSDKEINNIDLSDEAQIENVVAKGNAMYEEQLKRSLSYFHERFKILFDKMTSTTIQATDEFNKWRIQEEEYKAEIENLKAQLFANDDEDSDHSPGLIEFPSTNFLQRKCSFLERSYKHIRTLNENLKSEVLQSKKDILLITSEFESKIQRLILSATELTDKLRSSIPLDLFWKQNLVMNNTVIKYRKVVNDLVTKNDETQHLFKLLADNKHEILNTFQRDFADFLKKDAEINQSKVQILMNKVDESVTEKQMQQICVEIQNKNKQIETLVVQNTKLQELQAKMMDEALSSITSQELDLMRENLQKLCNENKILKEQCQHVESQLNIALLQLEDSQHRQLTNDMEINILKHEILDLQSTSDNKAILAKLSGELLVAHLQASEGYKKIESLNTALKYEKQLRLEAEEMLNSRQKIFDIYSFRYESKFRYMYDVMEILRQQYQGSTPTASIENYLNNIEDLSRKTHAANEKLLEIEDLQSRLMIKHAVYDQILDLSKNKCVNDDDSCPHKLKMIIENGLRSRELEHFNKKIKILEQSREELICQYNNLEKIFVLVNQGFDKSNLKESVIKKSSCESETNINLEMEDILSDDDGNIKGSQTVSLKQPKILKSPKENIDMTNARNEDTINTLLESFKINSNKPEVYHESTQTTFLENKSNKINSTQTDEDKILTELKVHINNLTNDIDNKNKEFAAAMLLAQKRAEDILSLTTQKSYLDATILNLKESNGVKDRQNEKLQNTIESLKQQLNDCRSITIAECKSKDQTNDENKYLLLKQLEFDKNAIVTEYKELLKNEREEYSKSIKELNMKVMELQSELDSRGNESDSVSAEAQKEVIIKYTMKIRGLQDKCFKLHGELDSHKTELSTYQNEASRWKNLATERLIKMEQLNSQLEQRHCQEVESYKAENQHWLSQLNDTQREHMELRTRIAEQKTSHIKQLADRDVQIEQLRSVIQNLKAQIMNMQTMISINDPSFDLSAIVEMEESDGLSQQGSERLELKFDSTVDFHDGPDDIVKMPATSTTIWQEPLVDRLRREKHLTSKQNLILRRQIKALAARERRARLDAQNLKSQVYRINTSGSKVVSSETVGLNNKIAALQSQLSSARRDTQSSISLWDKWKRAQQAAERWQSRYEEKFQETKKLEHSLNLAKSAVTRLEKEKRVLLTRLSEIKNENILAIEKQESEALEKSLQPSHRNCACSSPPPVSERALLERVQAQQRRIIALEVAEKGNEFLVSEYEKTLAEITSLKGQVLKLESTLLESQIRSPLKPTAHDPQPEVDYWKSYCEMLKEENVQLTLRVNALETIPATTNQQRVNDLEQTVLTLRGLVSKLQAEQKTFSSYKRTDFRPSSGRSVPDRGRSQSESLRIEIANLKRSIMEKDLLLEKSKEMLKIAAEREEELLRENAFLRRRLNEFTRPREGFLSI